MIYNSVKHPDESDLMDYLTQPDSVDCSDISLHLAVCAECREQLNSMSRLKVGAGALSSGSCDEQQQQKVDDFMYAELAAPEKEALMVEIKNDPVMLKSALHSLSQQTDKSELILQNKPQLSLSEEEHSGWLKNLISSWLAIPLTAFATLMITILVFQIFGIAEQNNGISIASYQDNKTIRFLSQTKMPGIGFFSSARQQSEPFENLSISLSDRNELKLGWNPVKHAKDYNLSISRYSDGAKTTLKKMSTSQTHTTIPLTEPDFNRRLEWTLSGDTTQGKTFITSGGFVITRNEDK